VNDLPHFVGRPVCSDLITAAQSGTVAFQRQQSDDAMSKLESSHDPDTFVCGTCGVAFSKVDELRQHNKLPWHIYNVKLRASGGLPIDEFEFDSLPKRARKEDKESASGQSESESSESSQSEPEDEKNQPVLDEILEPKVAFLTPSESIYVWKSVLVGKAELSEWPSAEKHERFVAALRALPSQRRWAIFLSHGGRFSAGIFHGPNAVVHKTFARYTVRKKQGGSQSSRDNQGHAPKSMGAQIRRAQTVKFQEDIQALLLEWKSQLVNCDRIFLFAPSANREYYFFENGPLQKKDDRIRTIPFATRRPVYSEVQRVHKWLSTFDIIPKTQDKEQRPSVSASPSEASSLSSCPQDPAPQPHFSEPAESKLDEVLQAVMDDDIDKLRALFAQDYQRPVDGESSVLLALRLKRARLLPTLVEGGEDINEVDPERHFRSALHIACEEGSLDLINQLLELGANPTLRDLRSQTPYQLCKSKAARLAIRAYAGMHPAQWPYASVSIPPLTVAAASSPSPDLDEPPKDAPDPQSILELDKERQKAKKKAAKERRRQKDKEEEQKKMEAEKLRSEAEAKKEAERQAREETERAKAQESQLSEREKRALAAEKRLAALRIRPKSPTR